MGEAGDEIELLYLLLRRGEGILETIRTNMGRASGAEMVVCRSAASGAGAARRFAGSRAGAAQGRSAGGVVGFRACVVFLMWRPFGAGIRS